jgi:hypothetical protein
LSIIVYEDLTDTGVTMRVSQFQDASGLTAILKYKSAFSPAGFQCADPQTAEVTVTDGDMSDASRSDFADQLKARIEDIGDEACTGYIQKGDIVNIRNFDGEDQALPEQAQIRIMTGNPGLRIEN